MKFPRSSCLCMGFLKFLQFPPADAVGLETRMDWWNGQDEFLLLTQLAMDARNSHSGDFYHNYVTEMEVCCCVRPH